MNPNQAVIVPIDSEITQKLVLSILWRASVAKKETFNPVQLGFKHEEKIRNILLGKDDPFTGSYEIWVAGITYNNGEIVHDLVCPPLQFKFESHTCYSTIFGGLQWYIKVSSHKLDFVKNYKIRNNGKLRIIQEFWNEGVTMYHMQKLSKRHVTSGSR